MSAKLKSADIAAWCDGKWSGVPPEFFEGVCTDSRNIMSGSIFIALHGENHDAHRFVGQAIAAGASAAVVRRDYVADGIPALLRVDDTNAALSRIAAGRRAAASAKIIGVTGSVGKTTVKEMLAASLSAWAVTSKTPGNFNNDVGLPLSILSMDDSAQFGVFEAGISHPGEMSGLCSVLSPDCGIVSAIAPVHLEALKSLEGVAAEKAGLLRAIPADGFAILDADGAYFDYLKSQCVCRVVSVSRIHGKGDFSAVSFDDVTGTVRICEKGHAALEDVIFGLPGSHNVLNALLACAAARSLGESWDLIRMGILRTKRPPMRWEVSICGGVTVINDAYNANPLSMKCALSTFARTACDGRRAALLGDMFELGTADEEALHIQCGVVAASAVDELFLLGPRATEWIRIGAINAGFSASHLHVCEDIADARLKLSAFLRSGDALLLKASRGMALERTVAAPFPEVEPK